MIQTGNIPLNTQLAMKITDKLKIIKFLGNKRIAADHQ